MITRRNFIRTSLLFTGFSAVYAPKFLTLNASNIKIWDKSICNFCSLGCNFIINNNKKSIYNIYANNTSNINKNILCKKANANIAMVNNTKRLHSPMLKNEAGIFNEITWEKAFEIMANKAKYALKESGVNGVGLFTSGNASLYDAYAFNKLFKAGFRSNNISNSSSYSAQVASDALNIVYGTNTPNSTYDDIESSDVFISWGANLAETFPILNARIIANKNIKKNSFITFNITCMKNKTSKNFDVEILIQPGSDSLLIKYIQRELVFNNKDQMDWNYLQNNTIFANINNGHTNDMKQWEVSFNAYKKSIIQYDLDFVARRLIVDDNENINTFKEKLKLLANKYIRGNHNITSYWASGINKRKDALNTNILLHSLHLLTNKHSRPGCGALSLAGQSSTQGTSIELGTFSHTLPANMFLKYTEHRIKTEQIWKLPNGTLNPISNENYNDLHDNIISGLTKFVWINNANPYQSTPNNIPYINKVKALKDLFIVTSDCFLSYSAQLSDLILPSASNLEKIAAFGNDERKTQFSKQKFLPYGNSMSDLWQCVEFSKKFDIKTLWGSSQIQNNQKIKSVLQTARQMGYKNNTSIYKVLFKNPSLKEHLIDNKLELNTEVLSDKRFQKDDLIDSFYGYDYFIQKYFHNEYKRFGFGVSYDMVDFFEKRKNLQWPVINKKGTKYRFNIKYDKYAYTAQKTNSKFVFYGKLGDKNLKFGNLTEITKEEKYSLKNKAKIFSITSSELAIKKNEEYPYLLTSVKILEHSNTGTITRNIQSLAKEESNAFCYINKETAKKHLLKTNDFIYIESEIGNVKVKVKVNDRVIPLVNTIAVTSFDNKVLINTITKEINNTFVKIYKI